MKESSARELGESSHLQEKKITHVVDILVLTHVLALTQQWYHQVGKEIWYLSTL